MTSFKITALLAALSSAVIGLSADLAHADAKVAAKGLNISDARLEGGKLILDGKAVRRGVSLGLQGTSFRTVSGVNGQFSFKVALQPAGCRVVLTTPTGKLPIRISNCGPRGADGAAGSAGAVGPIGPVGDKGTTGVAGTEGLQGPRGPQGEVGPRGEAGIQGAKGPVGSVGPQGEKGPAGTSLKLQDKFFSLRVFTKRDTNGISSAVGTPGVTHERLSAGRYVVHFPRDVSGCTYRVSSSQIDSLTQGGKATPGFLVSGSKFDVGVTMFDFDIDRAELHAPQANDDNFQLTVVCL